MRGLTADEVLERIQEGKVNINDNPVTRTYKQIILGNILTFFNFLNITLFVMIMLVGSYKNCLFIMVVVFNTIIGIVQEIRAKRVIDDLAIMTQSKTVVYRDGKKWSIATDKLVLDDVILLHSGDQIPADCRLLEGSLEVNESLLTGEADNIEKKSGEELFSGSFVTSGEAFCRVIRVGSDNYASRITSEAKEYRRHNSDLRNSLNVILKFISIIIVPIGALLFYKQYWLGGETLRNSVVSTVAGVLGMIPEGLILLTSVTLTIGAMKLALRKTLVQELYCIETLAKVDVLCLDKTGTITEGSMKVEEIVPLCNTVEPGIDDAAEDEVGNDETPPSQPVSEGTGPTAAASGLYDGIFEGTEEAADESGLYDSTFEDSGEIPDENVLNSGYLDCGNDRDFRSNGTDNASFDSLSAASENDEGSLYRHVPKQGGQQRDIKPQGVTPQDMKSQDAESEIRRITRIMGNIMMISRDRNATAQAFRERFPIRRDFGSGRPIDFSSDRKYSGAVFENEGTYLIGAAQFLFPDSHDDIKRQAAEYAAGGLRVIVLAHSDRYSEGSEIPEGLEPIGFIILTDVIREEAPRTMEYFLEQGVDLKVISGDDPAAVSAIAKRARVPNAEAYIDASTINSPEEMQQALENCSVFGRVTPQQKKEMVLALKGSGHTVAMTGDGVNDVLALKEADCSIAMAAGSDAAKNIANIVLLDSNFASMPHIVNQGRRVVNNIRTAASMFLIKTIFSVMLSLITIFWGSMYPFEPIQMSLISACAVGIPTFFLSQENNFNKVDHTFLRHVFMNAFPAAMAITGCVFTIMLISQNVYRSADMLGTACFLVTGWNYMAALKTVYAPLNRYRTFIIYTMQLAFFTAAVVMQKLLSLKSLEFGMIILVFVLMTFSPLLISIITEQIQKTYEKSLESPGKTWYRILFERLKRPWL